jgi:hypothetical protein
MRASLHLFAVLAVLIVQASKPVDAATITTIVDFSATNFTSVQGTTPPVDPVTGSFTLTFDQSQFAFDATSIVVNDLNIDLGSPISFSYNPDIAALTIGGSALGSGAFFWGTDDFSLGLVLLSGTTYKPQSFVYSQAGINDAFTASFSPVVPIPASAYLLATALAALGLLYFRRTRLMDCAA